MVQDTVSPRPVRPELVPGGRRLMQCRCGLRVRLLLRRDRLRRG